MITIRVMIMSPSHWKLSEMMPLSPTRTPDSAAAAAAAADSPGRACNWDIWKPDPGPGLQRPRR